MFYPTGKRRSALNFPEKAVIFQIYPETTMVEAFFHRRITLQHDYLCLGSDLPVLSFSFRSIHVSLPNQALGCEET